MFVVVVSGRVFERVGLEICGIVRSRKAFESIELLRLKK